MDSEKPRKILVVDDQPINIKLLQRKLERTGYCVLTASNGRECLDIVASDIPDLILLDVMMPEMDGIETCKLLKQNARTMAIPIIFITAKSSKEGKIEGLNIGAVDYITKPIDLQETVARVKTQLRIQDVYLENIQLQKDLGESRRSAAIGAITQGIAHNLNNLLGVVVGYLDLLRNNLERPDVSLRSVNLMDQAVQRMVRIIRQLSSIAINEKITLTKIDVQLLLESSIARFEAEYQVQAAIEIINTTPADVDILGNTEVFETVLGRLLINAWEAYNIGAADVRHPIKVVASVNEDKLRPQLIIKVIDWGMGISDEIRDTLFEPFVSTKTAVGRGLGLTMARHAILNIGGKLTLTPNHDMGTTATISYPLGKEDLPSNVVIL